MVLAEKDNKKNKHWVWLVLGWLVLTILSSIIGFNYGLFQVKISEKADIDITMPTELEDDMLPIWLDNIGDKELTNIRVKISSCNMDYNKTFSIEKITKDRKARIPFKENKTIDKFNRLACNDIREVNLSKYEIQIQTYKHNETGVLITPQQKFVREMCMYCYWDIYFYSDQLNTTFRKYTYQAGDLTYEVGDKAINITIAELPPEFKPYSPIGCSMFDGRIMDAYS